MGYEYARSRVLNDEAFHVEVGPEARFVHIDCSVEEIPTDTTVGRSIWRLFNNSPASRLAFGIWWLTDATGSTIYGLRPCGCHRYGKLETAADLLRLAAEPKLEPDFDLDLTRLREGMVRFRQHAALRERAVSGLDGGELAQFEAALPDLQPWSFPCKELDPGSRLSTITLGLVLAAGGNAAGLATVMDPVDSPSPKLREMWATALTDAALDDSPIHPAANAHLGLTYVLVGREEIAPAIEKACRERSCGPEDLPMSALPVPMAARERAAFLACGARRLMIPAGESALDTLRQAVGRSP